MRRQNSTIRMVAALFAVAASVAVALGQSSPTAMVHHPSSVFLQAGDTYTGLSGATNFLGGRNASLTAGLDIGLVRMNRYSLSGEARGTYPLYRGHVDGQKSLLGGVRLDYSFARPRLSHLLIYGNALAGRGDDYYVDGGYPTATLLYLESSSAVYGAGFGFEVAIGDHLSLKGEAELQHWDVPVTTQGVIYTKQGSGGIVYRFAGSKIR